MFVYGRVELEKYKFLIIFFKHYKNEDREPETDPNFQTATIFGFT